MLPWLSGDVPADGTQAAAEGVPALLVDGALVLHHVQGPGEGMQMAAFWTGRNMPKSIWPRKPAEGSHHVGAAHQEADPGASDV